MTDYEIDDMQKEINKEAGDDVEDGGVDLPKIQMVSQDIHHKVVILSVQMMLINMIIMNHQNKEEMIMSSEDFVDALHNGKNLEAEDAFKSAMQDKIGASFRN